MIAELQVKRVILARHGNVHNPRKIRYFRDAESEYVGLNPEGRKQMVRLGSNISLAGYRVVEVDTSPERRARQSAQLIADQVGISHYNLPDDRLDAEYVPGPYKEGLSLDERVNDYDPVRWAKYNHETPQEITDRMSSYLYSASQRIRLGEAIVAVSHGDAISFLDSFVLGKPIEHLALPPVQPPRGSGLVLVFNGQNNVVNRYFLP